MYPPPTNPPNCELSNFGKPRRVEMTNAVLGLNEPNPPPLSKEERFLDSVAQGILANLRSAQEADAARYNAHVGKQTAVRQEIGEIAFQRDQNDRHAKPNKRLGEQLAKQ